MVKSDLIIVYQNDREKEILNKFLDAVNNENLLVKMENIPPMGPIAGIHWLLPTAAFLFITKAYFDGFFSEMGSDHYNILKKEIIELREDFFGKNVSKRVLISSSSAQNKIDENSNKYSLDFSIMAEANNGNKFKLLIPKEINNKEYTKTITYFLDFLKKYNHNEIAEIPNEFIFAQIILVEYDSELGKLQFVNPLKKD